MKQLIMVFVFLIVGVKAFAGCERCSEEEWCCTTGCCAERAKGSRDSELDRICSQFLYSDKFLDQIKSQDLLQSVQVQDKN